MRGSIIKIHNLKRSRNGNSFIRVEFRLEGGIWAKTDICPDYINYQRWKSLLTVGTELENLNFKGNSKYEIDADSYPRKYLTPNHGKWVENPDGTMSFINFSKEQEKTLDPSSKGMKQEKLL